MLKTIFNLIIFFIFLFVTIILIKILFPKILKKVRGKTYTKYIIDFGLIGITSWMFLINENWIVKTFCVFYFIFGLKMLLFDLKKTFSRG